MQSSNAAPFKCLDWDEFIARKDFNNPIYQQIKDAYKFVCCHTNNQTSIDEIVRRDIYKLPTQTI